MKHQPAQPTVPSQPAVQPTIPHAAAQSTLRRMLPAVTQRMRPIGVQPTMPSPAIRQNTIPRPHFATPVPAAPRIPESVAPRKNRSSLWIAVLVMALTGVLLMCGGIALGSLALYGGGILPRVSAVGLDLGSLSQVDAAAKLAVNWRNVTLIDEGTGNVWEVPLTALGISLDAMGTAERAYQQGRTQGNVFTALRGVAVEPVLNIDLVLLTSGLQKLAATIETPALNAGVKLVNGVVEATPAQNGRRLDLNATIKAIEQNAAQVLADGKFELVMYDTAPALTDSTPLVAAASALMTQPLSVRVFDPVTGDIARWDAPPEQWAAWLTADSNANSPTGLALSLSDAGIRGFLSANSSQYLDTTRYLDLDKAVSAVQGAVRQNQTTATVRVYHHDRQHTVQPGETIISIAWDYGVPYPWVQQANPGVNALTVGQTITIPSADNFFQFEPIPDKRIEVSISEQRVRVYENGGLKWDWIASTGIASSPTWNGVYQIIMHEPNAYAANWDLWMPSFMGVYQPIPGANFTNGFHGFPTRGGGQLLWENSLGTKVTYGCILLSNENAQTLYQWAQEGVVVEILP